MPVLCLTIDNGPQLSPVCQTPEEVDILLWLFPPGISVREDGNTHSDLHVLHHSFHRCFASLSRLGPRQRATVLSFITLKSGRGSELCMCGQQGGQRLQSPSGSGQQSWQEKAAGCLSVDFLLCG